MKGKVLEEHCIARAQYEQRRGTMDMDRYGVQCTRIDDRVIPIRSKPDFEGCLRNGRQFIFDAKVCSQASFPLYEDKLEKRQREHLLKRSRFNVVTFLLIHFPRRVLRTRTDNEETWAFPVHHEHPFWLAFKRGEAKRIQREDCQMSAVQVQWDCPGRIRTARPDLLSAIEELTELFDGGHWRRLQKLCTHPEKISETWKPNGRKPVERACRPRQNPKQ